MRILVFQIAPASRARPVPRFDPSLGVLLRLLRKREHDLSLAGLSRFGVEPVKSALARGLPQLIYADISPVCADIARRAFEYIQQHEFVPIVAGGAFATADPAACLSLPGVHAAAIGEPDASLVTYLERVKDPAGAQVVQGIWLRDERGLARPELPALVEDLDSLPFPERELFGYDQYVRRTGRIEIAVGRGCPQQCAYCVNDWLESIYEGRGTWVRRRSPENVLAEIELLRKTYPAAREVRFLDHAFALDEAWLARFLEIYAARGGLPFRCHLRANATSEEQIRRLAAAGCVAADVELISGSDFIRNEIFDMELPEARVRETIAALRDARVRSRVVVYLGAPYESEASLDETRALLLALRPDQVEVRPYYPFPATRGREVCRDNAWLHVRGEEQYHADQCGIDMPACRPELVAAFVRRLRSELHADVGEPWWRRLSSASAVVLHQLFGRR